jgi:hypothetical protein
MHSFENLLAEELEDRFHSDMVEDWYMHLICISPSVQDCFKRIKTRYYADRILTDNKSITPKGHVFKHLEMDFPVDYDKYVKAQTEEECLRVLAQEFMHCIETMTYPVVLRKTFDRKAFEQCVRDILTEHGLLEAQ